MVCSWVMKVGGGELVGLEAGAVGEASAPLSTVLWPLTICLQ